MLSVILKNRFLAGLVVAVLLGFVWPAPGAPGGALHAEVATRWAVVVIFLLQGVVLPFEAIRSGVMNWRLHVLVQAFVFGAFPLIMAGLLRLAGGVLPEELRVGFLFLGALPTTISTAVVFTSMAGGNAAGALVNVTFANIAGVFLTPLWMSWFLKVQGETLEVLPLIGQLARMILLPFAIGQVIRPFIRGWAERRRREVNGVNSALVLFIVYVAFAGSVQSGVFLEHGWRAALLTLGGSLVVFGVVHGVVLVLLRVAGLPPADRIAALFCATQKTLGAGVPMAKLVFATNPALGLILLPVMIYHPVQLFIGGLLVHWLKGHAHEED